MIDSLRLFNIAMGNVPFVDDDIHELSIKNGEFPVVESPYGVILSSIFPIFTHSKKEFVRSLFVIYDIYFLLYYNSELKLTGKLRGIPFLHEQIGLFRLQGDRTVSHFPASGFTLLGPLVRRNSHLGCICIGHTQISVQLVVWNMIFICPYIGNFIIPTDALIFFKGVGQPPTI